MFNYRRSGRSITVNYRVLTTLSYSNSTPSTNSTYDASILIPTGVGSVSIGETVSGCTTGNGGVIPLTADQSSESPKNGGASTNVVPPGGEDPPPPITTCSSNSVSLLSGLGYLIGNL